MPVRRDNPEHSACLPPNVWSVVVHVSVCRGVTLIYECCADGAVRGPVSVFS